MEKQRAIELLKRQYDLIETLKGETHESPKFDKWFRDTRVAISNIFVGEKKKHQELEFINIEYHREPSWVDSHRGISHGHVYLQGLENARMLLQSFIEEINEYWPDEEPDLKENVEKPVQLGLDVFIVHGHDEGIKQSVARFIEQLELNPIILHEKPNQGRAIIEKFEDYANVGFAVVLMTPDDVGASVNDKNNLKPRSRQNVIFELGFFSGKLGRGRVCALYKGDVDIPSDYSGVLFIPLEGEWKLSLAKEIKAAGINIDVNKVI